MPASIRERPSAHGTRYQVLWRPGGQGARGQKTRTAGTFSTLQRAERVRDEVNERLAEATPAGYRSPDRKREEFVYIGELGGLLKIGLSSDPKRRCRELQADLLHVEPGGLKRERELHHRFRHLRVRGEFFSPGRAGEIRRYIRATQASTQTERLLDESRDASPEAVSASKETES